MKKQLLEVQNYFINKIANCDFDTCEIDFHTDGWIFFDVRIDDCYFQFSVHPTDRLLCYHRGTIQIDVEKDRMNNLIQLIESEKSKHNAKRIKQLKAELAELQQKNVEV